MRWVSLKKPSRRGGGAVAEVDFPSRSRPSSVSGGKIDELDLVGEFEDGIGHGLAHGDAGNLPYGVGAAFEVLDIQRGENVDTSIEKLDDVLISFRMTRAQGVGVGELVDEDELWAAREDGAEVHLGELRAAVFDRVCAERPGIPQGTPRSRRVGGV